MSPPPAAACARATTRCCSKAHGARPTSTTCSWIRPRPRVTDVPRRHLPSPGHRMPLTHLRPILASLALLFACAVAHANGTQDYAQPLLPSGPDPWVIQRDGIYYYTSTSGDRIELRKTRDLAQLAQATPV